MSSIYAAYDLIFVFYYRRVVDFALVRISKDGVEWTVSEWAVEGDAVDGGNEGKEEVKLGKSGKSWKIC